ncbi:MAG: CRP-like cAMP-binding protein, partial [Myxococcota bacterium]
MSLLENAPRMADARAYADVVLARLPQSVFHALLADNHPGAAQLLRQMATTLCQRLREVTAILQDIVDNPAPTPSDRSALDTLIHA